MSVSQHIPDYIKRVSKSLGYTLLMADADAWHGFTVILTARLDEGQRAALAWATLRSLTPEQVVDVAETVLPDRTRPPIALLFNHMDEATFWADIAEPEALEAYCLATFNRMPAPRQVAFLDYVCGNRKAAA